MNLFVASGGIPIAKSTILAWWPDVTWYCWHDEIPSEWYHCSMCVKHTQKTIPGETGSKARSGNPSFGVNLHLEISVPQCPCHSSAEITLWKFLLGTMLIVRGDYPFLEIYFMVLCGVSWCLTSTEHIINANVEWSLGVCDQMGHLKQPCGDFRPFVWGLSKWPHQIVWKVQTFNLTFPFRAFWDYCDQSEWIRTDLPWKRLSTIRMTNSDLGAFDGRVCACSWALCPRLLLFGPLLDWFSGGCLIVNLVSPDNLIFFNFFWSY